MSVELVSKNLVKIEITPNTNTANTEFDHMMYVVYEYVFDDPFDAELPVSAMRGSNVYRTDSTDNHDPLVAKLHKELFE